MTRVEGVRSETAVLVGVLLPNRKFQHDPLEELTGLARTVGAHVEAQLVQRRDVPDRATYLGKGKVESLKMLVEQCGADVVLFDNDLSPGQTRNLEKTLRVKVIDRTELILDIFAHRAQTTEARLAVELAQLEYSLPRLKQMWTHLSRIEGGIGMRGPGEKQLEVDRRLVEKKIRDLRRELAVIERRKERTVSARATHRTVSLVGYTNAGKSTLMNQLTGADVLAQDQLFATLDTRTRRWQLPGWGPVLLSDTVGFIRDLPHTLIASFKATLEESRQANLLLHVADASNPEVLDQIKSVYGVLEEIGIEEKNTLLLLNKMDCVQHRQRLDAIYNCYPAAIPVSGASGFGLRRLAEAVSQALSKHFQEVEVHFSSADGRLAAYLAEHGEILSRRYDPAGRVTIHCRIPSRVLEKISDTGDTEVEIVDCAATRNGACNPQSADGAA
ncbi:MAG: GTPase HflX [Planctomycetota bacterium]|nr:GTPase HflX [Planctomycetota bacterium]